MTKGKEPDKLGSRERQIMDIVYRRGRATASEVQADLPDPPSNSAVRGMLRLLEEKGHLRHEIAHYYWDQLISWTPRLDRFRQLFGNEEANYDAALQRYYQHGPPADWQSRHISPYASAHPWEDWAETWAHYLHIVDTVETAASFGITLKPTHPAAKAMTADPTKVAEPDTTFHKVLEHWLPLTYALNALNRGMGLPDLYPFVLLGPAIEKLQFVHEVVQETRTNRQR